jgi:hypothetical protein
MRTSVEREAGKIYLALREIDGKAITLVIYPAAANTIAALLTHAAGATEDYQGAECTIRAEMSVESEKSSPIP